MRCAQPEQHPSPSPLGEAQQALARGSWQEARRLFEAALADDRPPEALAGLGAAAWWLEDVPTIFAAREEAYRLFRERGDRPAAGRIATALGYDYAVFRAEPAISNGWLARAHRLLDDLPPAPEQAYLALTEAELAYHGDGDMEEIRRLAVRAADLARELELFDLEMVGLAVEGLALVGLGDVTGGIGRLDEASAAAVSGEMRDLQAIAATLCVMVFACERVQDVDRAGQWCDHYLAFCSRHGFQPQLALCRAQYASVLTARGRWDEADAQLTEALDGLRCRVGWSRPALERLGELRRRQGRLAEADESFERVRLHHLGLLGKARVALDRGDHELALELTERTLRRLSDRGPIERIVPLELLVQVHCARGDIQRAEHALAELESGAAPLCTAGPRALVAHRRGQVALAADDATTAKAHLGDALDLYESARLPFEAALVRLDLARALHAGQRRPGALDHCRAARDAFRGLGALMHAATAEALIDRFAQAERPMSGAIAGLSARETEVLAHLTRGLSNQQIAAELALSKHTVRRHVSNILTKLDLPSRTAAAVYALARRRP